MSDEDRKDIIKKIEKAGESNNEKGETQDDFGGDEENIPTEENVIHENKPKDLFKDADLGVTDNQNKTMSDLDLEDKKGIFGENIRILIKNKLIEMTETPVKEPKVVPTVKPNEVPTPTRRQKPWRVRPNVEPLPKAEE